MMLSRLLSAGRATTPWRAFAAMGLEKKATVMSAAPRRWMSTDNFDGEKKEPRMPEGISEEDLLKFLADPDSEGSPFKSAKVPRGGHGGHQGGSSQERLDLPLPEKSPDEVRDAVLRALASRPLRPGDTYNPLNYLHSDSSSFDPMPRRFQKRTIFPARLIVTGQEIHFTNVWLLSRFLSPMGRILPRWKTGLSPKKQRKVAAAVKRARQMGLLPYLHRYNEGILAQAPGELHPNPLCAPAKLDRNSK